MQWSSEEVDCVLLAAGFELVRRGAHDTYVRTGHLQQLQFRITHEGNELGTSPKQPLAVRVDNPDIPIYVNAVSNLMLLVPSPGRLTISATINEKILPALYLTALQSP